MNKLERTIIDLAYGHLNECRGWSVEDGASKQVQDLAKSLDLTIDNFCRREMSSSFSKCIALVELHNIDCGLSDSTNQTLAEIEKALGKIKRAG